MRFRFEIDVEIERITGKFATRDEMAEQIEEAIASANPDSLTGENEGEYEVVLWEVTQQ